MTTWIFSPLSAASVRRDPNETELFKTEQAGEGEYSGTDALVREVIQNSLTLDIAKVQFACVFRCIRITICPRQSDYRTTFLD